MLKDLTNEDFKFVKELLPRINEEQFNIFVSSKTGFCIYKDNIEVGILLYSILWEKFPFIQHLIIKEKYRNQKLGTNALIQFENLMNSKNYKIILLSTQIDEKAQFLYRKLGYIHCGGLVLENTPFDQPLELFMKKNLIK